MQSRCSVTRTTILGLMLVGITLTGCEQQQQQAQAPRTPQVSVVEMKTERVVLNTDLPGRTAAYLDAEVRPQVSGIIQARLFEEGQDVSEGDLLYQIDPARYEAAHQRAAAALQMAEAQLPALKARVDRYSSAIEERAVSRQAYDEAVSALNQSEATIAARKAELLAAQIDLDYTKIAAPISGRIGRSLVTVGALVTANQPTALATIRSFDPIYVDVMQSSATLLRLQRDVETGEIKTDAERRKIVHLRLEDGTMYPLEGTLKFRDITVDPTTGSYTLRIVFPNPDHTLLPGMFVRAIIEEGSVDDAIMVPQQGVSRTPKGEPMALVVDDTGTVVQRLLKLNRAIGDKWLVEAGLSAGEKIIVEGMLNVRAGMKVDAVPFKSGGQQKQERTEGQS